MEGTILEFVNFETDTESVSPSRRCVACGKVSPATDSDYTLISARFGWRLSFARTADGKRLTQWRCPDCWQAHKRPNGSSD